MARLVIDASACVQAVLARDAFGPLVDHELAAPPLLWSETTSALHELLWRRTISSDLALAAREQLLNAPIERLDFRELHSSAWDVAERLGWAKTYDAEYVATACYLGCPLLTIDARLHRGARRLIETVVPADL